MEMVISWRAAGCEWNLDRHGAASVNVSGWIGEKLVHAAMRINQAGDAVVGAADERQVVFDGAENGGGSVLPLLGTLAKPSVIGQVNQKISVVVRCIPAKFCEHIFKTDER